MVMSLLKGKTVLTRGIQQIPLNHQNPANPLSAEAIFYPGHSDHQAISSSFLWARLTTIKDKFWAQLDGFEGTVGSSLNFKFNNREVVRATYRTGLLRFLVGYSLYERENRSHSRRFALYGYGGMRLHYLDIFSDLNRVDNSLDLGSFWGEPVFGIQNRLIFKNWLFILQGDVGGFYSGRNYSYMIQFLSCYRISNLLSLKMGWSDWDINHKKEIRG